ncbi:FimV/HubP family polar landmark protein [Comamonas sp. 17RB]|uniref:FimV/HubP family polar landmark protein n=1 Tax=Comamonas sp. 17RB TaxID=3047025 RepID=UPI0024B8679F|nr:FimV/HubP family polar landmark protein [Comamonas sp. 17RB]MDI9854404.1 FimV/HubP family polar landmark protein [Comamonas sp. 17RB]
MHRWKLSALAAAAFASAALTPTDASALTLGRIAVQSALGEPLRAEIDVPQATAAELDALQARIANPDVFKAHGMEYSNSARQVQVEVVRQPDGTAKLKLSSRSPVSDPFMDLVIDANWAAGHLVRSYTLLLDPAPTPQAAAPTPAPTNAPQISASRPAPAPASVTGRTVSSDGAAPLAAAPAPASTPSRAAASSGSVTVRAGDTAGQLANAQRPAGVSLDQMLVAMLRANPNAFVNGNVNRLRAGSVVQMPSKDQASATTAQEARQIVAAQSRDFNEFRRRLAGKAQEAKVAAAERASSGQVQAQVQDNSAAAAAADKLTLSKGALNQHAAEEKLAKDKQASAQADRVGELQRNLSELQKVASASAPTAPAGTAGAAAAPAAAATPGVTLPVEAPVAPAATADASATTPPPAAPAAAEAPSADASAATPEGTAADSTAPAATEAAAAAATPQPSAAAAPAPAPAPAPGVLDELTDGNPLVLPAAGGVLALLLGLLGWRIAQRRRAPQDAEADTASDSPVPPDAFFADSGGQQVDTHQDAAADSTALDEVPSQLDSDDTVDPVAEAEVYLAYGRDVQAEEILLEALRTQPEHLGVHMKLAEIHAKRQDAKALEATALSVQALTHGVGPSWDRIVELGQSVDAGNPLYHEAPAPTAPSTSAFADALAKSHAVPAASVSAAAAQAAGSALGQHLPPDLDLNLDLPGATSSAEVADAAAPVAEPELTEPDLAALEPDWDTPEEPAAPAQVVEPLAAATPEPQKPPELETLNFTLDDEPASVPTPAAVSAADIDLGLNLGDLDLDLGDAPAPDTAAAPAVADDPLSTKLDLAREFHAIGDSEGARTLVEEVIAEASGDLKERAQNLLAEID